MDCHDSAYECHRYFKYCYDVEDIPRIVEQVPEIQPHKNSRHGVISDSFAMGYALMRRSVYSIIC